MERKRPGKERKKEKLLNLSARGLGFRPAKELARVIEEKGPFTRGDDVLFYTELYIVSLRFLSNSDRRHMFLQLHALCMACPRFVSE